jgi:NitT/TauT family transport system substrate-binding protein
VAAACRRAGGLDMIGYRFARAAALSAAAASAVLALGAPPALAADARNVKIAMNFTWQPTYMPLLYGQSKGFFRDAGISPEILPLQGSLQALQMLDSGNVDYAFVDADTFLLAAAAGKTASTAVYVWLDKPTFDIVSIVPIKAPADLSGKTFATTAFSSSRTLLPYVLKSNGVDPATVKIQTADFAVLLPSFLNGEFETVEVRTPGSWQDYLYFAKAQGKKLSKVHVADWGLVGYDKILIVRNRVLRDSPADVKRVVGALDRSLKQAISSASDDEVGELLRSVMPQGRKELLIADWHDYKDVQKSPGAVDPNVLQASLVRLSGMGVVKEMPAVDKLYRNQVP